MKVEKIKMISITKYLSENLFPSLSDFTQQPIDNHGPSMDVGTAKFSLPAKALHRTLKTNIEHMKENSVCASSDYKTQQIRNENGGTPQEYGYLPQFKLSKGLYS